MDRIQVFRCSQSETGSLNKITDFINRWLEENNNPKISSLQTTTDQYYLYVTIIYSLRARQQTQNPEDSTYLVVDD